jgi:hypothetical protein
MKTRDALNVRPDNPAFLEIRYPAGYWICKTPKYPAGYPADLLINTYLVNLFIFS